MDEEKWLSDSERLQTEPLLTARPKPLTFRENSASGVGLMGPDPNSQNAVRRTKDALLHAYLLVFKRSVLLA